MYRDISLLSPGGCIELVDDRTLRVFNETPTSVATTYKLIGDKYIPTHSVPFTPPVDSSVMCYTTESIETLPSQYDFLHPFLETMAILSFIGIVYAAYRLVLYPFFRRRI